ALTRVGWSVAEVNIAVPSSSMAFPLSVPCVPRPFPRSAPFPLSDILPHLFHSAPANCTPVDNPGWAVTGTEGIPHGRAATGTTRVLPAAARPHGPVSCLGNSLFPYARQGGGRHLRPAQKLCCRSRARVNKPRRGERRAGRLGLYLVSKWRAK